MKLSNQYIRYSLFTLLFIVSLVLSCSIEKNYKALSFFFDGVPEPEFKDSVELIIADGDTLKIIAGTNTAQELKFIHIPYKDKDCSACHDRNNMGGSLSNQTALCFKCHEDFTKNYAYNHGPAVSGNCTSCHEPHEGKIEKLLRKSESDLCYHCHEQNYIENTDIHSIAEIDNCLNCHNPHGEENAFLLKDKTCYVCHDNYAESFAFLHGPVASGFCNSCHDSHQSEEEFKLPVKGQDLCYKCHNRESLLKTETHMEIGDFNCTECHNPHGGEDNYILN